MKENRLIIIGIICCISIYGKTSKPSPAVKFQEFRVLLVGDSWSYFMWLDKTMRELFAAKGHPYALEKGDVTAISGSKASEWIEPSMLQKISDELIANPKIDVVQLSMGGNDFLAGAPNGWYTTMSFEEEVELYEQILSYLDTVVQHIRSVDPTIQILIGGYDYPNFQESLSLPLSFFCTPYWDDMVQPTPFELNTAMTAFEDMLMAYAETIPELTYVRHLGSMQFLYGYPSLGIEPGELLPPGDLEIPSPMSSMRLGIDCFHLNSDGYDFHALNLWDSFYSTYFCLYIVEFNQSLPSWRDTLDILDLSLQVSRLCPE